MRSIGTEISGGVDTSEDISASYVAPMRTLASPHHAGRSQEVASMHTILPGSAPEMNVDVDLGR